MWITVPIPFFEREDFCGQVPPDIFRLKLRFSMADSIFTVHKRLFFRVSTVKMMGLYLCLFCLFKPHLLYCIHKKGWRQASIWRSLYLKNSWQSGIENTSSIFFWKVCTMRKNCVANWPYSQQS